MNSEGTKISEPSQAILLAQTTRFFDARLSMKGTFFAKKDPSLVYQDLSPCCELIANVYFQNSKYLVKSGGELKFTVDNLMEAFDCIVDISRAYKKYGICWNLYNKLRQSAAGITNEGDNDDEYEKYSIYVSDYDDNDGKWIIDVLTLI